ncbi:MAG TPA: hypothetical protein PK092_05845 [Chitinophagaceae bacterium]|nr:hypothetical protein [Chitinophagaceae bacterium]
MEQGWDPEVKKFFLRIINTVSWGLLWLMACATAGLYFQLAYKQGIYTVIFYVLMAITFFLLLRYFFKIWKNDLR